MSTNPLARGIGRRTLLKAGLTLGALQLAGPFVLAGGCRSKEIWAGSDR